LEQIDAAAAKEYKYGQGEERPVEEVEDGSTEV
jgi:hypothetical protein